MTIRVRCDGCSAVMKVKDELAGAKGKCPKCKTPFVVPAVDRPATTDESREDKSSTETSGRKNSDQQQPVDSPSAQAEPLEAPIDLPLEVTPPVPAMDQDDFDPAATLASGSSKSIPAIPAVPISEPVNKPSVADLMKEHTEKKGRLSRRKEKTKTSKAAQLAQPVVTSGTAADALNRKYDQKRDESAASEQLMTREERRQAEQKEAMIDFAKKGIPALAGVLLLSYGLMTWMLSASLPPLGYASGIVTRNGSPMSGVQVVFAPKGKSGEGPLDNATPSQGFTDANGEYTLIYDKEGNEGVLPGNHEVSIMSSSGMTFTLPADQKLRTVEVGEDHSFDFNL